MKRLYFLFFFLFVSTSWAQNEILRVGIARFDPPFVMQMTNNQAAGFDIRLMNNICKELNRICKYQVMPFKDLLVAVRDKRVDVSISSITITLNRAKIVNFSLAYLESTSMFLGRKELAEKPFSLSLLKGATIGVIPETTLMDFLVNLNLEKSTKIKYFNDLYAEIDALNQGTIDMAFVDAPTARYLQILTSNNFVALGTAITTGAGFGIAVNKKDVDLLQNINKALLKFQGTKEYQQIYDHYIKPLPNTFQPLSHSD